MKDMMPYLIKEKVWDVFLEMRVDNMSVEKRIGGKRLKYPYGKETSTIASLEDNYYRFTPYFTKDFDNLSFYVTQNKLNDMIEVTIKDSKTIQLSSLEFNYILSEGLTTVLLPDTFTYGYLTAHESKEKMTYNIALSDKIKAKNLKKHFTLESPYFNLRY